MVTFVIAKDGTRLMPTYNVKKVRKLLRSGRAKIYKLEPFTIQLKYETEQNVQSVSEDMDTGYAHPGLSIKSEKHEYVSAEYELLPDEKERHDDRRRYRRARRNRKRHRKMRFNKDTKPEGWFAPSIKNRADRQIALIDMYMKVCPITSITLEIGQFDVQILTALEKGLPIPESVDYQYGPRYGFDTLREAVFARDGYTCVCCGISGIPKNNKKGAILRVHHLGY